MTITTKDAIKHLSYKIAYWKGSKYANDVLVEALELAVIALEKDEEQRLKVRRLCPACGKDVVGSGYYCWNCGKHLRWEEEK